MNNNPLTARLWSALRRRSTAPRLGDNLHDATARRWGIPVADRPEPVNGKPRNRAQRRAAMRHRDEHRTGRYYEPRRSERYAGRAVDPNPRATVQRRRDLAASIRNHPAGKGIQS